MSANTSEALVDKAERIVDTHLRKLAGRRDWSDTAIAGKSAQIVEALRAAGTLAPEPEWEYGIKAEGDDEPWSDISSSLEYITDSAGSVVDKHDVLVRRRAPGPWVPMEQEGRAT